jgi:hypothetical protein
MLIANPIYDGAFKFLMKDKKVARHFLSVLLNREIDIEGFEPTEDAFVNHLSTTGFSAQRMDFTAIITDENGHKRKVLIELQKGREQKDIGRFRQYLAKAYYDADQKQTAETHQEIISIYILGFPLNIPVAVVRTSTKLIDASTQQELNADTDDESFIRQLHHESVFVDLTKLNEKMQNRVDRLLVIFNQSYMTENKYSLDLPIESISLEQDDFIVIERLNLALQDNKTKNHLIAQAEFSDEIDSILHKKLLKNTLDAELNKALKIAKAMKEEGLPYDLISKMTGISATEIEKL